MASDGAEDSVLSTQHSVETSIATLSSCLVAKSSSVFSSPVSDLALNLEVLSTDGFSSQGSASTDGYESLSSGSRLARRRLSLVTDSSSSIRSCQSADDGFVDSPSLDAIISPTFYSPAQSSSQGSLLMQTHCARFRRIQSMPPPFCGFEPTPPSVKQIPRVSSSPSTDDVFVKGISRSSQRSLSDQINPMNSASTSQVNYSSRLEDVMFKDMSRSLQRPLSDSTNMCHDNHDDDGVVRQHHHPQRRLLHPLLAHRRSSCSSLDTRGTNVCNRENDEDAEFLGDMKSPTIVPGKPPLLRHLSGLLFSPVLEDNENMPASVAGCGSETAAVSQDSDSGKMSAVRGLFRSPSVPCRVNRRQSGSLIGRRNSQKRAEVDQSLAVVETKRQKSCCDSEKENPSSCCIPQSSGNPGCTSRSVARQKFHRSHSETEVMIKSALSRAELHPDLIGDFSKPYCLPLISVAKHPDLKAISPHTMALLMQNEFSKIVETFTVVDCRFPYEFAGGHIQNGKNIFTREDLMTEFFSSPPEPDRSFNLSKKRDILIFHCEFSSERAPNLLRFLRRKDRDLNVNDYPHLFYPEVYLLDGGYKSFYEQFADLCSPRSYVPMLHADHNDELKYYRAKSLSWSNDKTRIPSKIK